MSTYVEKLTMSEAFYNTVATFPKRTAQVFNPDLYGGDNHGHFNWQEVQQRVENIASGLLSLGLDKTERVAIMSASSPYWTHTDVAVINCGAVLVTIYPTLSLREVTYIINDSSSRYLFVGSEHIAEKVLKGMGQMPSLEKLIVLDIKYKSPDKRVISLSDLMELGQRDWGENQSDYAQRWKQIKMEDWATILYTSGTTGQGKGAILSHESMSTRMDGAFNYFIKVGHPLSPEDRVLSFLPLSHIFDRSCAQWPAIYTGAAIAYADSPATIIADMQKYNPTWFSCVPRLYEKIYMQFQQQLDASPSKKRLFDWALAVGDKALTYRTDSQGCIDMRPMKLKARLPLGLRIQYTVADKLFAKVRALFGQRFRFSFSASAGIAPDLLRFFYIAGLPVLEGYGLTETVGACVYNPMYAAKPGSIGPQANDSLVRLAEDGELEISGAGIFVSYLNQAEENEAAFTPDGWFRTGDLAQKDTNGYYRIVDRKKAIICLAIGKNVAPLKVESLFTINIGVEQVFVVGDERNFISALIVPNFNYFIEYFERKGIVYDKSKLKYSTATGVSICIEVGEEFIAQPDLQEKVAIAVNEANKHLEEYEAIKQYAIIPRRFTEENDELTPTQKTKKRVILEHYQDLIEELYQRKK